MRMAAWMAAAAAAGKAAAAQEAAKDKEKLEAIGVLAKRPAAVPRDERGLLIVLDRYLNNSMCASEKKKGVCVEQQHLLKRMEAVTLDVIGRDKDDAAGLAEIKPKLVTTFKLRQSEVSKLVAQKDKVQLHKDKGERMRALSAEIYGSTPILKLCVTRRREVARHDGGEIG